MIGWLWYFFSSKGLKCLQISVTIFPERLWEAVGTLPLATCEICILLLNCSRFGQTSISWWVPQGSLCYSLDFCVQWKNATLRKIAKPLLKWVGEGEATGGRPCYPPHLHLLPSLLQSHASPAALASSLFLEHTKLTPWSLHWLFPLPPTETTSCPPKSIIPSFPGTWLHFLGSLAVGVTMWPNSLWWNMSISDVCHGQIGP